MVRTKREASRAALGGIVAGFIGGLFLTVFMVVMSAAGGKDIWYAMKGAAAPFFGERAMLAGFDAPVVAVGLIAHYAISIAWGVLFVLLAYGMTRATTVAFGVLWGVVVWFGMYYLVLPIVGLSGMRADAPPARAIAFHVVFSIVMTVAWLVYQRVTEGPWGNVRARLRHAHV